jgi:hypothetical protein
MKGMIAGTIGQACLSHTIPQEEAWLSYEAICAGDDEARPVV